jgi:hypothetical protein
MIGGLVDAGSQKEPHDGATDVKSDSEQKVAGNADVWPTDEMGGLAQLLAHV